jgi:menaquinone-dependent protoporphyrinogen oxidase
MSVLVAVASKHGGTRGIADAIANELRAMDLEVEVADIGMVDALRGYDAVILGSAIYAGRWMGEARKFVDAHRETLSRKPVWLFSSGPIGEEHPLPAGEWPLADQLVAELDARGHHTFAGRLEPGELGFGERLIAKALHTPYGDFRDWDEIRVWAREIGTALRDSARGVIPA